MVNTIDAVVEHLPINQLRLDSENPRIPVDRRSGRQIDLACELVINEDSFEIAQSIALQGFYPHDALIAIPSGGEGEYVIVEGNRRLSALFGLVDSNFRKEYFNSEAWDELANVVSLDYESEIPVMVMPDRLSVVSIIGNRHLKGIRPWTPFSQANYIATLIEDYNMPPEMAAEALQIKKSDLLEKYRELQIARQVGDLNIDTARLENNFSLLTVAMSNAKIRQFIGAPTAAQVQIQSNPISDEKVSELRELITYVYGDGEVEAKIADSRQMVALGKAISSEDSLEVLRKGGSLEEANERLSPAPISVEDQLGKQLLSARNALEGACSTASTMDGGGDFAEVVHAIEAALQVIRRELEI
jgi:hypothetical protein